MKTKLFVIVLAIALVFGLNNVTFGQAAVDTVGDAGLVTDAAGAFDSEVTGSIDFDGPEGTAGDSASHVFWIDHSLSAGTIVDNIKIVFPAGFELGDVDTIPKLFINDTDFTDSLVVEKDISVPATPTIILKFAAFGAAPGVYIEDVDFGGSVGIRFAFSGIRNDTSLTALTRVGRFYTQNIDVRYYEGGLAGGFDSENVLVRLQSAQADEFKLTTETWAASPAFDTVGLDFGDFTVKLEDRYDNIVLDTCALARFIVVDANTLVELPGDGKVYDLSVSVEKDTILKPLIGDGTGDLGAAFNTYGYTRALDVRIEVSVEDDYGYKGGSLTSGRSASGVTEITSVGFKSLIPKEPSYLQVSPLHVTDLEILDKTPLSATVTDEWDNPCDADAIYFIRNFVSGEFLEEDGTTSITTAREASKLLDAFGSFSFNYKAGSVVGTDTISFTVFDIVATDTVVTNITQKVDIDIVAGAVQKISITPTSGNLVAVGFSRYEDDTYGSTGAVVAGNTVVFYAKLKDSFGNAKDVTEADLAKINFEATSEDVESLVKTKYRSVDGDARWTGGGTIVSSGGVDYARFRFVTPEIISRDSVVAFYMKTTIDSIASDIDNTISPSGYRGTRFTTIGGPPAEVVEWILPNGLDTDTIEVTGALLTTPTVQLQATLEDEHGNWADILPTVKVRFEVESSDPDARGDAGFVYLARTVTDDTTANKNEVRIDPSGTNLGDTTSVITKFIADSAKGTSTIRLSRVSDDLELGTIDIFKQPDKDISEIVATISNVNPPAELSESGSALLSGFYAGATREVFAQFKDEFENIIEPDTIAGDNVPKYTAGVLSLDALEFTSTRVLAGTTAYGAFLTDTLIGGIDEEPDLENNDGYAKISYKADGGVEGEDTLIVRFVATPTINDSIKIVISLPEEIHHFVMTVLTTVIDEGDTAGMCDVPISAGAYHTVSIRPSDEVGNPIYDFAYEYMKLELIPAADEELGVDTNKVAPSVTDKLPVIHWIPTVISLVDSVGGTAWSSSPLHPGEDTIIVGDVANLMVASTKTLNQAKIALTVKDTAGIMVYDTLGREWANVETPKLLKWIPTSTDTIEMVTDGELAEQTQFKLIIEPKDIFKNRIPDTTYQVLIKASDVGISGIDNQIMVKDCTAITISVDHPTTVSFAAEASETREGITVGTHKVGGIRGFIDDLTIEAATINPPAALNATDFPGDAGGWILLEFPASANHPGMDGVTDDNLAIDYYQVYRNTTSSLESALNWAYIPATPLPASKDDTIRAVVSTNGAVGTAYYWVAAVKGDIIPVVSISALAKVPADLGENVVAAVNVEAGACEAKEDLAVLTKDGRLISEVSPANKARPINNTVSMAADLDGSNEIDILDIAIITEIYDYPSEYDPVVDLNNDGTIDILDIAVITEVYGQSALTKGAPVKVANDGVNISSSIKLASTMSDFGDYFTMTIAAEQVKELAGYQFAVSYNPNDYELASINEGDFLSSNDGTSLFIYNDKTEGKVIVAGILFDISDEIAVNGSGIFASLIFDWIGDEVSEVTVDNIKLMDTNQRLNTLEQLVLEKPISLPTEFNLAQNYPNPFNPATTIKYALPKSVDVEITIYNILGQKVKTLLNEPQKAGFKKAEWDGTNDYGLKVGSGVYIYRLRADDFVAQMKMVFLK